jgi:copper chaperone
METITMKVNGMTCGGCVASVERVLRELDGVQKVDVSLEKGEASVAFDADRVRQDELRSAIEDAGYDVVA